MKIDRLSPLHLLRLGWVWALCTATHIGAQAAAPSILYAEVEAVAASDVALYICKQAYPAGLPQLQAKLTQSLQGLNAPAATLRRAPNYTSLYNSQLSAILTTSKKEREIFCKEAAQ